MQIHAGVVRNHNERVFRMFGPDKGSDIPRSIDFVHDMRPLLNAYGNEPSFSLICFTLDETTYARELAPLAGHYPAMKLGPAWWFDRGRLVLRTRMDRRLFKALGDSASRQGLAEPDPDLVRRLRSLGYVGN